MRSMAELSSLLSVTVYVSGDNDPMIGGGSQLSSPHGSIYIVLSKQVEDPWPDSIGARGGFVDEAVFVEERSSDSTDTYAVDVLAATVIS